MTLRLLPTRKTQKYKFRMHNVACRASQSVRLLDADNRSLQFHRRRILRFFLPRNKKKVVTLQMFPLSFSLRCNKVKKIFGKEKKKLSTRLSSKSTSFFSPTTFTSSSEKILSPKSGKSFFFEAHLENVAKFSWFF